jgi:hypothetical protein
LEDKALITVIFDKAGPDPLTVFKTFAHSEDIVFDSLDNILKLT